MREHDAQQHRIAHEREIEEAQANAIRRRRTRPIPTDDQGGNELGSGVRHVPDDAITSRVEVLRLLMSYDALLEMLTNAARERFDTIIAAEDITGEP
jgi:hypothetical protein